jgi:GPI mannosyltransferase 3
LKFLSRGRKRELRAPIAWVALLVVALGLRVGLAVHWPNVLHADEIFQTLEPAHRLAYGYGVTTWEWRMGVRSWALPAFLASVMRMTAWAGSGASGYMYGIIIVLSLASLSAVWFSFAWGKRASGMEAAIIGAGASAIYFGLFYFAPKALSEVVATHLILPGLYLGVYGDRLTEKKRLFWAGFFCGLGASLRIQLIPAIIFAAVYFCYPHWRKRIPVVTTGLLIPILVFGLIDAFTWSYPWQSFGGYFYVNVIQGRSLEYGVEPWYWYLPVILSILGPVILFVYQGAIRSPFLAIFALIVLVSHSLMAHKEIRFLYPIVPLAIALSSIGVVEAAASVRERLRLPTFSVSVVAIGLIFFILSSVLMASQFSSWCQTPGALAAFDRLSRDSTLCGAAFYRVRWFDTGGYTHLHRDVPIVPIFDSVEFASKAPTFNALVAPTGLSDLPTEFKLNECSNDICVYRRAGLCKAPQPGSTINEVLRSTGN